MTSTNDGKDVKSNQTSGQKGKKYYLGLYHSLKARLSGSESQAERVQYLCEAWRRIHSICRHAAVNSHPILLDFLEKHTAHVTLQSLTEAERTALDETLVSVTQEINTYVSERDGNLPWEEALQQRADWYRGMLGNPWGHPVLKRLLDPEAAPPDEETIIEWLKGERQTLFECRVHELVASKKTRDHAISLVRAVMDRRRAGKPHVSDLELAEEQRDGPAPEQSQPSFEDILGSRAGFTEKTWDFLTDVEFTLLHKAGRMTRFIELAKLTPLKNGYDRIESLQSRLNKAETAREKKMWKDVNDVAVLIAQMMVTRCLVVPACTGGVRAVLFRCARALFALLPAADVRSNLVKLVQLAVTAAHLYVLAKAVHKERSSEDMKPFVCDLFVRALTSGVNELEKLKLKPDKEQEARQAEKTLASWFLELGRVFGSVRLLGECTLTAFSVHPSREMYENIRAMPELPPVRMPEQPLEPKLETNTEFGSWASDSRSQTNFVKTSEHLNMKHTQQANVLSTAILNEGEALGLGAELCQDIAVLLSGPRVKTLSWDMDRELLLSNCMGHMERTAGGTRALTTELRYLHLDPKDYQHLREEDDDDENDLYYGIEKGYEHLVELPEPQPETVWEDTLIFDDSNTESAYSTENEDIVPKPRKKKTKKQTLSSCEDEDPLSTIAEAKKAEKKKERPHSKERSKEDAERNKERKKKPKKERSRSKDKESKKERKKKVKAEKQSCGPLSQLIGVKVERPNDPLDSDCEGKSSIASLFCEENNTNVEYDGQFSMDELKSPDRKTPPKARKNSVSSAVNTNKTDEHVDKQPQTTINPEVKNRIAKLLQFRRNKSTTSTESSSSPAQSPVPFPNQPKEEPQIKTEPMSNWVGSKIVNPSDLPKGAFTYTQSLELSSLNDEISNLIKTTNKGVDSRNNLVSKTINKAIYEFTDMRTACARTVPVKSYSRNRMCSIPELQLRYLESLPQGTEGKQEQKLQRPSQNVLPGHSSTPQVKQHPSSQADKPSLPRENKTETPRQSVIQRSPVKQSQSHQSTFEDFLKGIHGPKPAVFNTDAKERCINKAINPATRASPVLPTILKPSKATVVAADVPKAEPMTSQSAKPVVQQKKPENAPNTFARLSYMHKSKQNDAKPKADAEPDQIALQKSVSDELDKRIAEMRQYKINLANPQRNLTVSTYASCTKPKESPPRIDNIKLRPPEHLVLGNTNPVFKGMLKMNEIHDSYRRIEKNAESSAPPSLQKSALSDKDQQDLINMLKQQNKLNDVRQSKQSSSALLTNLLNSNPAISIFNNNTQIKAPNQQPTSTSPILNHHVKITKQNQNLPQTDQKDLQAELISKATILRTAELIHSRIATSRVEQTPTVVQSSSKLNNKDIQTEVNLQTKHAPSPLPIARNKIAKTITNPAKVSNVDKKYSSPKTDYITIMDAIRKQKTPSRGPNALEMVLKNEAYEKYKSTQSLRNLRIVKQKPEQTYQSTADTHGITTPVLSSAPVQTKANTQSFKQTEIAQPKKHIIVESTNNHPLIKIQDIPNVNDPISQTLNSKTSKESDPFISGIQNSEYDLIGELMDDELRQELGELSSDEEKPYKAPTNTKNNKNVIFPGGTVLKKTVSTVTNERKPNTNRNATLKPKHVFKTSNTATEKIALNEPVDVKSTVSNESKPKLKILSNEKVNLITRPSISQNFSKNMTPQISQENTTRKDTCQVKPAYMDTKKLIITAPPPPSSNVVVIRPDMPYEQYPTLHITEAPVNSENSFVAASNIPTMNTIQLTNFSPVMAPVLMQNSIGLSTLLPTASSPIIAVSNVPQTGGANSSCDQPTLISSGNTHNTIIKMASQSEISGAENISMSKLSNERNVITAAKSPNTFANKGSLLKPANMAMSKTSSDKVHKITSSVKPASPIELSQQLQNSMKVKSTLKINVTKNKSGVLKPKRKRTIVANNESLNSITIVKHGDARSYPGPQDAKILNAQSGPEENIIFKPTVGKSIELTRKAKVGDQIPSGVISKMTNPALPSDTNHEIQEKHITKDEIKSTITTENMTSNTDNITKPVAPNLTFDLNVDNERQMCQKKVEIKSKVEPPLLQNAVPLLSTQTQPSPHLEHKANVLSTRTDQIHLPQTHQAPEIKNNIDTNKICERKVLSEVQEKLTIPCTEKVEGKITRNQGLSTENDRTIEDKKEKDKYIDRERLKKKRLAIINRETSFRCCEFVIVLPYAPIKDECTNAVLEKQTDLRDQKIGSDKSPSPVETRGSSPASTSQLSEFTNLNISTPESPGNIENTVQNVSDKNNTIVTSGKVKKSQANRFKAKKEKAVNTVTTKSANIDLKKQGQDSKDNVMNSTDVTPTRVSNRIRERKLKKSVSESIETNLIDVQESSSHTVNHLPLMRDAEIETIRKITLRKPLITEESNKIATSISCELSSKFNVKSAETDLQVDTTKATDVSTQLQKETIHIISSPDYTPDELSDPDVMRGAPASRELLDLKKTSSKVGDESDKNTPQNVTASVQIPVICTDPNNVTNTNDLKSDKKLGKDTSDLDILSSISADGKSQKVTAEKKQIKLICHENGEKVEDTISIPAVPIVEKIIAENNSEKEKKDESLNNDVIAIDSDLDVKVARNNDESEKNGLSLNTDVIPIDSDSDANEDANKKSGANIRIDDIPQSYKNGISFEELPNRDPNDPLKRTVRVKLPNGKLFKATVYGSMTIDFESLLQDPNLKRLLNSNIKEKKRVLLNVQQLSTTSNEIIDTRIKSIRSEEQTVLDPNVVNLISDDEADDETVPKESKLKLTTEFGSYAVKSLNKEHFDKHQIKLLQKCSVKLVNCDSKNSLLDNKTEASKNELLNHLKNAILHSDIEENNQINSLADDIDAIETVSNTAPLEVIELDKKTEASKNELLNHLKNAILNSDIEENNQIISLEDDIDDIKTVSNTGPLEVIELDDSSDEDTIPKIHPGEKIDDLKNLLLKDLGVVDVLSETKAVENNQKSSSVSNQSKLKKKYKAYVEPTKKDYSSIIPYECFVKLQKCDNLVRKMEDEKRISDISTEVINLDEDFETKLPRSGSFSILNDVVGLDEEAAELTEADIDRSSPIIDIVETITAFHGYEADSYIGASIQRIPDYDSYQTTLCCSDWFDTKKKIRSRLVCHHVFVSEDNVDTTVDSKTDVSTDYESDADVTLCSSAISDHQNTSVKEIGEVPSLQKIMTDYYARDFPLNLAKSMTESKNVITCKRKLVVDCNEGAKKMSKIDEYVSEEDIDASKSSHQAESNSTLMLETNIEEILANNVPMSEVNHEENEQDSNVGRIVNHPNVINLKKIVCTYIVNNFVSVILHTKHSKQTEHNHKLTRIQDKMPQDDKNITAVDPKCEVIDQDIETNIEMDDSLLMDVNDSKKEKEYSPIVELSKSVKEVENAEFSKETIQELEFKNITILRPINATEEPFRETTTSPHLLINESEQLSTSEAMDETEANENSPVLTSTGVPLAPTKEKENSPIVELSKSIKEVENAEFSKETIQELEFKNIKTLSPINATEEPFRETTTSPHLLINESEQPSTSEAMDETEANENSPVLTSTGVPLAPTKEKENSPIVELSKSLKEVENAEFSKDTIQELEFKNIKTLSPINATEEPFRETTTSPHLLINESEQPSTSEAMDETEANENFPVLFSTGVPLAPTTGSMNEATSIELDDKSKEEDNSVKICEVPLDSKSETLHSTEFLKLAGISLPVEPTSEIMIEDFPIKITSPALPTEIPHENIYVSDSENNDQFSELYRDASNHNVSANMDKKTVSSEIESTTKEQDNPAEMLSPERLVESTQDTGFLIKMTLSELPTVLPCHENINDTENNVQIPEHHLDTSFATATNCTVDLNVSNHNVRAEIERDMTVFCEIMSTTESSENLEHERSAVIFPGKALESAQEISDMEYVTCSENSDIDKDMTLSFEIKFTTESFENEDQDKQIQVMPPGIPLESVQEICDIENGKCYENFVIDKDTTVSSEISSTTESSDNIEKERSAEITSSGITSSGITMESAPEISEIEYVTCSENSNIDEETTIASEIKTITESSQKVDQNMLAKITNPGTPVEPAHEICETDNMTSEISSERYCDTPVKRNGDEGADKENETIKFTENEVLPLEHQALEVFSDDKLDIQQTKDHDQNTLEDKDKLHLTSEVIPASSRQITEVPEEFSNYDSVNKEIIITAHKEDTISSVCVDGNDNLTSVKDEDVNEIDQMPEIRNLEDKSSLNLEESKIYTDAGAQEGDKNQNNIDNDIPRVSYVGENKTNNDHGNDSAMTTSSAAVLKQVNEPVSPEIDNTDSVLDDVAIIVESQPLTTNEGKYYCETEIVEESVDSPLHSSIVGSPPYDESAIDKLPENIFHDKLARLYKEGKQVLLNGVEYEDPEKGTFYVFTLEKSSDSSANISNSTVESIDEEKQLEESAGEILSAERTEESAAIDSIENMEVMVPTKTYTKLSLKRKLFLGDISLSVKKRRLSNLKRKIDSPKLSNAKVNDSLYIKEFTRLLEYCSTIEFSYSISFHKDQVDVENIVNDWPILGDIVNENQVHDGSDDFDKLFEDLDEKPPYDPLTHTLAEELITEYVLEEPCKTADSNFSMGFGEGSGRVIQNFDRGGVTKFSAATLSDVKHSQPFLLSEDYYDSENEHAYISTETDQIEKLKHSIAQIQLRDQVRSFFKKTALELSHDAIKEKQKTSDSETFPFDLYIPKFFEPAPVEVVVQVVQVGQLPVSAAAQNPVTCDPRVTQVSDASPSQCSEENSPRDDSQQGIKTEYTELTTADLSMPMENYQHHIQTMPVESQEARSMSMTGENIPIETELIKSEVKIELVEETSEDTKIDEKMDDTCDLSNSNNHVNNIDYTYHANNTHVSMGQNSSIQLMQPMTDAYSQQKQQNGAPEKTDQIAHAMSAAGISTTAEPVHNTRAQALVNIISQKIRHSNGNAAQNSINTYSKSSPITAMALQQALAQILPPPLNQTNAPESNQGQNPTVTPQVLHIVQGKNASGNQITLVDNSQQSVINQNATPVLHILQNKAPNSAPNSSGNTPQQQNTFSGLSLVDTGLQQGGNQLLHIVNTGNQKNANAGQLLKRVNLLTNLTNVPGSNDQKMVQFVCKSADGKSIQLNAPHQRSMVLRLQPIESPNIQTPQPKPVENQDMTPSPNTPNSGQNKETASQQEIKSRSVYEENYAKFIQSSSVGKPVGGSTSLPKFNQAFGKSSFQDGNQKQPEISGNNTHLPPVNTNNENTECPPPENNSINLEHISQMSSPPLLLRKSPQTSQPQPNLVQQIKQTIAPMNIQTMHGGVIYTRQIPVNIGGGQTINLITVPSTELIDDKQQSEVKFVNQGGDIEPSIIKIVPQSQPAPNAEVTQDESNNHANVSNENAQNPQPQPVLTQMRIKLPMLSKTPQMVSGARVVRPSFFQIQRNVIGGANQQVYQQLVLTAAPPLGQQTIRLPQGQAVRPKAPSETQSSPESQMSSSTLEQLREFDMVLEQVKERSTVQPNSSGFKLNATSSDTTDSNVSGSSTPVETSQPVLYSIGGSQQLNVAYVNRKAAVATPSTSTFVRSPDSTGIADSPSSSNQAQSSQSVSNEPSSSGTSSQSRPRVSSKSKSRPKSSHSQVKINSVPPKPATQKPLEDEQTTQRILYILAEYKEQVENSPDKDKPAPRRRSNPPSNPGSSKRKKSSSGSRRPGARDASPVQGDDACRTMGSEDSSCGTSQGDCTESCMETHSPQDSPRKVARKLTFEQETAANQPRPQPQRNVIVADGQTITVARGAGGKPATAVLMPANYILPVSMVKGGQQIAIVTNRGPKLLTVGGGEGGATNALLLQRLIGPAGLKPVLARPGVRHVRLPTAALHNLQTFNLASASATTVQPPDSTNTASPAPAPTPPELIETRAEASPWPERESESARQERAATPEGSEPWNMPTSSDAQEYSYEETVRAENMDRTVLDPIPDRYSPDMEAQRIFDKMFDVESKKCFIVDSQDEPHCGYGVEASEEDKGYQVVQKKEGPLQRAHRVTHISAAALRHKYAILEHELRLQKSLSEECEDLGVDSPSASELFPEAELLFAASPAQDPPEAPHHNHHTPQPTLLNQTIEADIDDQIATDQLIPREENPPDRRQLDVNLGLEDVGIVTVSEDGMQATIALDQEEFARSHPNTTFHSEPSDAEVHQPFTITGIKGGRQISTIFHANRVPATVLMTAPQATTVISQTADPGQGSIKYSDIDHMISTLPGTHANNVNLNSVLVKDDGLTRFENILTDSRELHLSNTASAIVHPTGNATQVIRRVCYDDGKRERDARFLMDEPDTLIAGDDAKMVAEDSSRDATMESMVEDVDDDNSSSERHAELFWESNSASERSESRRPLDYSSDSEKCCKSPSFDETNSTDSSGLGTHMRHDSVIKEARLERSGSAEGSSADDTHPPLRTYPPKRMYHNPEAEMERSLSGKTRAGERSPDLVEGRRRTSVRGVVKRGCHCCNGSPTPAPPRPKKPRQRKPTLDFNTNN